MDFSRLASCPLYAVAFVMHPYQLFEVFQVFVSSLASTAAAGAAGVTGGTAAAGNPPRRNNPATGPGSNAPGGAINAKPGSRLNITGCSFTNINAGAPGGAIYASDLGVFTVSSSTFRKTKL